ncbi:MAG: hypothetical protein AAFY45_13520, partial [Bacteroidota bacterium]
MKLPLKCHLAYIILILSIIFLSQNACAPHKAMVKILKDDLKLAGEIPVHYKPKILKEGNSFHGIKDYLSFDSISNKGSAQLNILMVPGVRDKDWSNYNSLIAAVTKELKFKFDTLELHQSETGIEDSLLGYGEIAVLKFLKESPKQQKLNFFVANWTSVTRPAKQALYSFDYDLNGTEDPLIRTYLADKAKRSYMIEIFSDMALYRQKDFRAAINNTVQESLGLIYKDQGSKHPLLCITGSMGSEIVINVFNSLINQSSELLKVHERFSKEIRSNNLTKVKSEFKRFIEKSSDVIVQDSVLFDNQIETTLKELDKLGNSRSQTLNREDLQNCLEGRCKKLTEEINLGNELGKSLQQIFMLNNQLVFSSILDYTIDEFSKDIKIKDKVLDQLESLINSVENPDLKIVSFYDPNDILGFQIPASSFARIKLTKEKYINIPITHTTQWSIDAKRLKDNYIVRLPLGDTKDNVLGMIGDSKRINIGFGLDGPSEFAKANTDIWKYIVQGSDREFPEEEPPSQESKEPKIEDKTDKFITEFDELNWKYDKELLKEKKVSIRRVLNVLLKVSGVTRAVELPYSRPTDDLQIGGLKHVIDDESIRKTFVLTVHGMANKTPNHFDPMAAELAKKLGFVPNHQIISLSPNGSNTDTLIPQNLRPLPETNGKIKYGIRKLLYQNSEGDSLIFVIVHWSPISRKIKQQLFDLDELARKEAKNIPGYQRGFVHKTLKDKVIIDGFVDVNLALGDGFFLNEISDAVNAGMREIWLMDSTEKRNVFFISGSLGSKVLYEHITQTLQRTNPDINSFENTGNIIKKTICWYMLTNQIPMIGLKELASENRTQAFQKQVWHGLRQASLRSKLDKFDMEVIAFHDPNDLMTFRLPKAEDNLGRRFRVHNLPLRTGGGFEVDLLDMYKFVRKVDRRLYTKVLQALSCSRITLK